MKRRITAALLTLLLTVASAAAVSAEETEPTVPTQSPETTAPSETTVPESVPTELSIETEHIYDGMERAYCDGYIPDCEDGFVRLVLPLQCSGSLWEQQVTASLVLDGGAFVAANYEKTFHLEQVVPEGGGEAQAVYLVDFTVELSEDRQNGVYPVAVQISALDSALVPVEKTVTLYVTITDGPAETKPPEPEKPTAEPVVYISKCTVNPEQVLAGTEFALTLTLKNSLTTKSVRNLLVRVDTGNLQLSLAEDGNVFQIDRISSGGEEELTLLCRSDANITAGKYAMQVSFQYDSSEALNLASSGAAMVEIRQPSRLELVTQRFPESVTVGETVPLSLQVLNMGRDAVHNVRCSVSGPGLSPSNTGYIGTMAAGSDAQTDIDLYIMALNTSPGNEQGSSYGPTQGTLTLTYEDAAGQEYQQETRFQTTVNRAPIQLQAEHPVEEQEKTAAGQWWNGVVVLGGVGIACIIGTILARRRSRVSA